MNADYFARLTLETWRASGLRTEPRRDALLTHYLESYFGAESKWSADVADLRASAGLLLRQRTRIDELAYV